MMYRWGGGAGWGMVEENQGRWGTRKGGVKGKCGGHGWVRTKKWVARIGDKGG